ncbi:MAG: IPT/TIG domain-containing protein, partial [Treponema sp.]|nr:IPT/TIG domain-containing protein [Treponema sp.]
MRNPVFKGLIPLLFALCSLVLGGCGEKPPVIDSIEPRIGRMGDIINIYGENFGTRQEESYVTIAGTPPTSSSYVLWQDDRISVKVPEFGDAGLVYVHKRKQKSNPVLFSNRAVMPELVQGSDTGINPQVAKVEPASGSIGSLITVLGSNFGSSGENSAVAFAWEAESSAPADIQPSEAVVIPEPELDYEFWSEREIRVRVPDGAVSGNLEVRTLRGNSRPVFFEITGKPGTKTLKDKRSYTLSYTVDIKVEDAAPPNSLYLWLPIPARSASQRNLRLLNRSAEPFVENYRGTSLYQFIDLVSGNRRSVTLSFVTEVYAVETGVRAQSIKTAGDSPIAALYTQPSALIPSDSSLVKTRAAAITGRERNPYAKARLIYDWLVAQGGIQAAALSGGAAEALEEKRADSYRASLLFCALARAAGVPALPVSGVLVNRLQETSRHYWAEFWIEGFGWIPLDPALGAGAAPENFNLRPDHGAYYFGSLDNNRI